MFLYFFTFGLHLRWLLGLRKPRSSGNSKFWKLFLFCKLHHEKTFFYHGGKKRCFFLISTMKLSSTSLSYLNVHSALNFARTFLCLNINTNQNIKGARFEFYMKQSLNLGAAVERCSRSKLSGPATLLHGRFWGFWSHFRPVLEDLLKF